ncbi:MAG: hypothetical protein HY784_13760 [Chloroflexi bacterium]|nr:hypothetical protein [Chloroflexota bacterium]
MKASFWRFRHSLRARVALGVALPAFLAMSSLSLVHYLRERQLVQEQARLTAAQIGEAIIGSLQHAMLLNDRQMLSEVLDDLGRVNAIRKTAKPARSAGRSSCRTRDVWSVTVTRPRHARIRPCFPGTGAYCASLRPSPTGRAAPPVTRQAAHTWAFCWRMCRLTRWSNILSRTCK